MRSIDAHADDLAAELRVARTEAEADVTAEFEWLRTSLTDQVVIDAADSARVESASAIALRRIDDEIRALQIEVDAGRSAAKVAVAEEIASLQEAILGRDPGDAADRAELESKTRAAVASIESEIAHLRSQRALFLRVSNWFRVSARRRRIRRWGWWRHDQLRLIELRIDERKLRLDRLIADTEGEIVTRARPRQDWLDHHARSRLDGCHRTRAEQLHGIEARSQERGRRLDRLESNPEAEIDHRTRSHRERLDAFQAILTSPEMIGARAEARVAEELQQLSNEFEVIHHLRLRPRRFLRHNGTPVVSAEIDHIVVGPTGVYLIETKCWGARFVAEGEYFDPFEQVERAGLLCHVLLKDSGLPAKVRQIVTPFGSLPKAPTRTYVQVVPPERLRRFIERGRPCLESDEVRAVAEYLWDNFSETA